MKSVLITFDQAYYERIMAFSTVWGVEQWIDFVIFYHCQDSRAHTWPGMASEMRIACFRTTPLHFFDPLLDTLHKMDLQTEQLGLRAFVWNIERTI